MSKLVAIGSTDPNGYARASFPQGVANPFVPNVIPYPSNLHGSQWKYVRSSGRFMPAVYNVLAGDSGVSDIKSVQELLVALNLSGAEPQVLAAHAQFEGCASERYRRDPERINTLWLRNALEQAKSSGDQVAAQNAIAQFVTIAERHCYERSQFQKWLGTGAAVGVFSGIGVGIMKKRSLGTTAGYAAYGALLGVVTGVVGALVKVNFDRNAHRA